MIGVMIRPKRPYGIIHIDATVGRTRPMIMFTTLGTLEGRKDRILDVAVMIAKTTMW